MYCPNPMYLFAACKANSEAKPLLQLADDQHKTNFDFALTVGHHGKPAICKGVIERKKEM